MNRDLEKYIEDNREDFDRVESFDLESSWTHIQANKQQESKPKTRTKLIWILTIALLIIGSFFIGSSYERSAIQQEIANLPPDLIETHESLITRVNLSESRLGNYDFNASDYEEIMNEIKDLEDQKSDFLNDFNQTGNKEQYARILLRNYERKARIIELLIYEINKKEKDEQIKNI